MMINLLEPLLSNHKVLILGFGKEGRSTFRFIRKNFPGVSLAIADRDPVIQERSEGLLNGQLQELHTGPDYLKHIQDYSLIIKSPGVSIPEESRPAAGTLVTSQTRLMLEAYHRQIIGITGTKGKSTTTSLVHHLLQTAGINSILVGNIGLPPFDYLESIGPETRIVYEMSSHQLEDSILAPHISVLLNLFPEHLDRYPSLEDYYSAKMRILTGQIENDTFIYNEDIPGISERIRAVNTGRNYLSFSSGFIMKEGCYLDGNRIFLCHQGHSSEFIEVTDNFPLKGQHNRMNMMAAILSARQAGASEDAIRKGLFTFTGLEHRLEYVGCFRDIYFYNDSIATIPEATIAAVRTLPATDTLILGGFDRMLDYSALVDFLVHSSVKNFIFLGKAGQRMLEGFRSYSNDDQNLVQVNSLQEAFEIILKVTGKGKICLLSPAAASYDSFRNFEERGSLFKKIAESL
jgi:UDP-N-acetylmuramoylalanine--D-glutamate ligase